MLFIRRSKGNVNFAIFHPLADLLIIGYGFWDAAKRPLAYASPDGFAVAANDAPLDEIVEMIQKRSIRIGPQI